MTSKTEYTCDLCGATSENKMSKGPHIRIISNGRVEPWMYLVDEHLVDNKPTDGYKEDVCEDCTALFMKMYKQMKTDFFNAVAPKNKE